MFVITLILTPDRLFKLLSGVGNCFHLYITFFYAKFNFPSLIQLIATQNNNESKL